jgi:tRNA(Ile)-lysidine synthase
VHNVPDDPVEPVGLLEDEVDTLFSGLNSVANATLAVSGGADSLCLLVLFSEWMNRTSWPGRADVVVVDHGLRAESAVEAEFVSQCAEQNGLACRVLCWTGDKPARNVQEEARRARYRLIANHMKQTGAEALLLGHHLDDQAETFLDRLTRGSGIYGLSAMATDEPDGPEGLRLLRPFLGMRKSQLEASLRDRGLSWCADPSNEDSKYKRSRLRRMAQLLTDEGLTVDRIAQTSRQIRLAREALEFTVQQIFEQHVVEHAASPLKIDLDTYRAIPEDLRLRLLTLIISRASGVRARLRLSKVQALDAVLLSEGDCRHTLSGALFATHGNTVFCWREPGRSPPETLVNPCGSGLWDKRYVFSARKKSTSRKFEADFFLGPLCNAPVSGKDIFWPEGWPKEAFDCSPVVWLRHGNVLQMPVSLGFQGEKASESPELNLERVPFQGKLLANYISDEDRGVEI